MAEPRVLCIGNCQLEWIATVLRLTGAAEAHYHSSTPRHAGIRYDPEATLAALGGFDVVLAQAIRNPKHPFHLGALRAARADVVLVPYVYLDGLFSLLRDGKVVIGGEPVEALLRAEGLEATLAAVRTGQVDFDNRGRLERTLTTLRANEEPCSVRITDYVEDVLRERLPMVTHNHPQDHVLDVLLSRIGRVCGFAVRSSTALGIADRALFTLGKSFRVFSPYDRDGLGLRYGYDLEWFLEARRIIEWMNGALGAAEPVGAR